MWPAGWGRDGARRGRSVEWGGTRRWRIAERRSRFPLTAAFGLSVALHLLLALLTLLTPWLTETAALEELEPTNEISFTFVDRPDTDDDRNAEPAPDGNAPVPELVEPAEPIVEEVEELVEPPMEEAVVEELAPAEEAVEPIEEPAAEEEPAPELDLPSEDAAPAPEPRETPRMNVNEALRDFGSAMSRRPPPPPRSRSDSPTNVFVPDLSQVPSSGFGMGNLTFESTDYDWTDYARQIYMAIWRAWHNRLYATSDDFEKWAHQSGQWYLNNQSGVRFVIERNGEVTGIALEGDVGLRPARRLGARRAGRGDPAAAAAGLPAGCGGGSRPFHRDRRGAGDEASASPVEERRALLSSHGAPSTGW